MINISISPENSYSDILNILQFPYDLDNKFRKQIPLCSNLTKPKLSEIVFHQSVWQLQTSPTNDREMIYIYSAYYDDRSLSGEIPQIRLFTILSSEKTVKYIFCHFWYNDLNIPFITKAIINSTGINSYTRQGIQFREHTISCPLNKSFSLLAETIISSNNKKLNHVNKKKIEFSIPNHVSLTLNLLCNYPVYSYSTFVQVIQPKKLPINEQINFGICMANGHGIYEPEEIAEWFEFYELMGVIEFNMYNTSYSQKLDVILEYYTKNGIKNSNNYYKNILNNNYNTSNNNNFKNDNIELNSFNGEQKQYDLNTERVLEMFQLPHPLGHSNEDGSHSLGQIRNLRIIALNDCMYKNMYRYKYMVVVDHDEFIVPRGKVQNYSQLFELIETKLLKLNESPKMSYSFYNAYFFLNFDQDLTQPTYLKTARYKQRVNRNGEYYASKSILSPLFCFNLFNHYCYEMLPLYNGTITYFVSDDLALSHHYRKCQDNFYGNTPCVDRFKSKKNDFTVFKFVQKLKTRVDKILNYLSLNV